MNSIEKAGSASQTITLQFQLPAGYVSVLDALAKYEQWDSRQELIEHIFIDDPLDAVRMYLEGCQFMLKKKPHSGEDYKLLHGELPAWIRNAGNGNHDEPTMADICYELMLETRRNYERSNQTSHLARAIFLIHCMAGHAGKSFREVCRDYSIDWLDELSDGFIKDFINEGRQGLRPQRASLRTTFQRPRDLQVFGMSSKAF